MAWYGTRPTALDRLLPPGSGSKVVTSVDINDAGQIVGLGTFRGETRGYLLTP